MPTLCLYFGFPVLWDKPMNSSCSVPKSANVLEACINMEETSIHFPNWKPLTKQFMFQSKQAMSIQECIVV
jgi:hypothetical protein